MTFIRTIAFNLKLFSLSSLVLFALHPNVWLISQHSYQEDSLFVLSSIEIGGLLLVTMVMAITLLLFNIGKTHYLYTPKITIENKLFWIIPFDLFLTIALFFLFWAIAPQIHYLYYQQIMEDLQNQWVIGGGMNTERAIRFVTFSKENSIADHANGLALWLCLLISSLYPLVAFKPKWIKSLFLTVSAIALFRLFRMLFLL